jgi:hypothetical protein
LIFPQGPRALYTFYKLRDSENKLDERFVQKTYTITTIVIDIYCNGNTNKVQNTINNLPVFENLAKIFFRKRTSPTANDVNFDAYLNNIKI